MHIDLRNVIAIPKLCLGVVKVLLSRELFFISLNMKQQRRMRMKRLIHLFALFLVAVAVGTTAIQSNAIAEPEHPNVYAAKFEGLT